MPKPLVSLMILWFKTKGLRYGWFVISYEKSVIWFKLTSELWPNNGPKKSVAENMYIYIYISDWEWLLCTLYRQRQPVGVTWFCIFVYFKSFSAPTFWPAFFYWPRQHENICRFYQMVSVIYINMCVCVCVCISLH